MKKTIMACLLGLGFSQSSFASTDYCLGIRGNGENAPAHWSALSRIVREVGMPKTVSAGSSGSYAAFLLESVAVNEQAQTKEQQSALLQTFSIYLDAFLESSGARELLDDAKTTADLEAALKAVAHLRVLNPELFSLKGLAGKNFKVSADESIRFLGGFDAVKDDNLFVRAGLIDFKYVALRIVGRMGDLYAGNSDKDIKYRMGKFIKFCSDKTSISDSCQSRFKKIASDYIKSTDIKNAQSKRIHQNLSGKIKSYISTGLILGEGVERVNKAKKAFRNQTKDSKAKLKNLTFDFDKEIGFGYFGDDAGLDLIDRNLEKEKANDLKSSKFTPIGQASWFEVLSVSPAEPGLANIQDIPYDSSKTKVALQSALVTPSFRWKGLKYRKDMVSVGGWSDLHPVQVLKASGCDTVMYLTRQNGDSVFAQQVFIRLVGEQEAVPFWKDIKDKNREGWTPYNSKGWSKATEDSAWNQLYNLGNENSSYSKAIKEADVVYCTDWDRHSPKDIPAMLKDAFTSPTFLKPGVSEHFRVNPIVSDKHGEGFPGCVPKI